MGDKGFGNTPPKKVYEGALKTPKTKNGMTMSNDDLFRLTRPCFAGTIRRRW
jgi:hypothetical protein